MKRALIYAAGQRGIARLGNCPLLTLQGARTECARLWMWYRLYRLLLLRGGAPGRDRLSLGSPLSRPQPWRSQMSVTELKVIEIDRLELEEKGIQPVAHKLLNGHEPGVLHPSTAPKAVRETAARHGVTMALLLPDQAANFRGGTVWVEGWPGSCDRVRFVVKCGVCEVLTAGAPSAGATPQEDTWKA